jgi:membrane protease YdiL (CAAX protease family)
MLLLPLVMAYGYEFPRAISKATVPIVLASIAISLVNGAAEELLWRGVYPRIFPESKWWGYLYPIIGFALWHLAPQSLFPYTRPGGMVSLVVVAGMIGLMWGWVAFRTRSIRWTTLSHILLDFSGLGGRVYF